MSLLLRHVTTLKGPLALECYERVDRVLASIGTENIPNVRAIAENLTRQPLSHPHHEQWVTYARSCVKDGLNYFKCQLESSLKTHLAVFKGCWLFYPRKVREMNPTAASVDESLSCIPFFDANEREKLKEELPTYLAKAVDIDRDFDQLQWWKLHTATLPNWSAAAKKIILIQPSSAAAERVFSLRHLLDRTWLYKTTLKPLLCFNTTSDDSSPLICLCNGSLLCISYGFLTVISFLLRE